MPWPSTLEKGLPVVGVGSGGFVGAILRYGVETIVPSSLLATATVNVVGCLAFGVLLYEHRDVALLPQSLRRVVTAGMLASFTTYSTFILDAITTEPLLAVGYIGGSYALGFAGVIVGRDGARWLTTGRHSAEVRE